MELVRALKPRGGLRRKKKLNSGQSLLLQALWRRSGGSTVVAKKLEVSRQDPMNWKHRGHVPMRMVGQVARMLKVPQWGLNYSGLRTFHGEAPPWKDVVKSYKFDKETELKILLGTSPE